MTLVRAARQEKEGYILQKKEKKKKDILVHTKTKAKSNNPTECLI
jgi:hypothetical protein